MWRSWAHAGITFGSWVCLTGSGWLATAMLSWLSYVALEAVEAKKYMDMGLFVVSLFHVSKSLSNA
jgi:hypothetical protein